MLYFITNMSQELFAYLLDIQAHIMEKNTLEFPSLLHKYHMFILEKIENKISKIDQILITFYIEVTTLVLTFLDILIYVAEESSA